MSEEDVVSKPVCEKTTSINYEPYAIKKMVGKVSMKQLAARAAAKVTAAAKSKDVKPDPEPVAVLPTVPAPVTVNSDSDDDVVDISPPKRAAQLKDLDGDSVTLIAEAVKPVTKPKRKKRLNKAQKADEAKREREMEISRKAREDLLKALANADDGDDVCIMEPPAAPQKDLALLKEPFLVLWNRQKFKFSQLSSDSMAEVFKTMAVEMKTEVEKVLIFCNGDPSKTISPLDRIDDIGSERMFLAAFRETQSAADDAIPEAFQITLYVQCAGGKNPRTKVVTDRRAPMEKFMDKYSSTLGKTRADFQFTFDGDKLNPKTTAEQLDLEGDEVIDAAPV